LEHIQIHDTGNGRLHEEEETLHSFFAEDATQEDTWIFAAPDPAVVGIGFATDVKRVSSLKITESRNLSSSCIR
jgi:hypothetical protein